MAALSMSGGPWTQAMVVTTVEGTAVITTNPIVVMIKPQHAPSTTRLRIEALLHLDSLPSGGLSAASMAGQIQEALVTHVVETLARHGLFPASASAGHTTARSKARRAVVR
jgi:hypothetical protein